MDRSKTNKNKVFQALLVGFSLWLAGAAQAQVTPQPLSEAAQPAADAPQTGAQPADPEAFKAAAMPAAQAVAVKRRILALYDSRRERQPHLTRIHRFAEMPLNHLGFVVDYRDVNAPLPGVTEVEQFRGVLTWFLEPLRRPEAIIEWLEMATEKGLKHVVLGDVAPPEPEGSFLAVNGLLNRMGLQYTGNYVDVSYRAKVARSDPDVMSFERPIDKALPDFPVVQPLPGSGPNAPDIHLSISMPDREDTLTSVVVATGPGGGFAANNFTIYYEANTDRVRWMLNPFRFFGKALGAEVFPIPDVTTVAGRRIYFSHIDGDGWNNLTEVEGYRQREMISAEVVARELIEPFPDLPVSIGIIAGDVDARLGGDTAGATIARRLYALPQVEVGSHTYSHPYNWQFFETYDRKAEEAAIQAYQRPSENVREQLTRKLQGLAKAGRPADLNNRYIAGSDDLPRTYLKEPFDLVTEVQGALDVAAGLAPAGKRARIYLWSGDTTPFPGAVAATRRAGVRNINGGDSRLDREYPSVAYVPPISRPAGEERQIYSVNSNENTYTNDWTGPFHGYLMLEHTLENTESPRRLKGMNVYYHMYSGEKPAALVAVRHFLEMARSGRFTPIEASHYAAMADDFFAVTIAAAGPGVWELGNLGAVSTVRFDAAADLEVDLARSTGVIGSTRHAGSLYVALDPARTRVTLATRTKADPAPAASADAPTFSLVESRWPLSHYVQEPCAASFQASGFGPGEMVWRAPPGRMFRLIAQAGGRELTNELVASDKNGRLGFRIPASGRTAATMRLECHG